MSMAMWLKASTDNSLRYGWHVEALGEEKALRALVKNQAESKRATVPNFSSLRKRPATVRKARNRLRWLHRKQR